MADITFWEACRRFIIWLSVCVAGATPSFLVAREDFEPYAMALGVGIFVVLITFLSCTQWVEDFKKLHNVRKTLYIGYTGRVILSLAVPIGIGIDFIPGIISVSIGTALIPGNSEGFISGRVGGDPYLFERTLLITLIQGTLLNIIVLIFMALVYPVTLLIWKKPRPGVYCAQCQYDLRGSVGRPSCPECGAPVVMDTKPEPTVTLR